MITIKALWLYVAVFAVAAGGVGVSYFLPMSSPHDLERELRLAHQQIEELKKECPTRALKRAPIIHSPGREF